MLHLEMMRLRKYASISYRERKKDQTADYLSLTAGNAGPTLFKGNKISPFDKFSTCRQPCPPKIRFGDIYSYSFTSYI